MCLLVIENQYNGAIMEVQSELETNIQLCNVTLTPDGMNWTKNNSSNLQIAAPGHTETTFAVISVYCVLFVIAAAGNLSVVITLFRSRRHRRSRVSLMICHLAVADLMVAFIMIPLEVGWRITVAWHAGNIACKFFLFMRAFCLYLSSNVLVCVSLDRCFAVIYPLRVSAARKRGKIMLVCAWFIALLNALPQSVIFHVQQHPKVPGFVQCVTFGFFKTVQTENAYNLFCVIAMYFLPLMIISGAYSVILCEISNRTNRSHEKDDGIENNKTGVLRLRCSDLTHIERARQRTLRLTVTIVAVFIWCWTPYVVMTLWYVVDRDSAQKVNNAIQDGLFLMAVSNSCMNPLVYGSYAMKCRCPWNKRRGNELALGVATGVQRRSTDVGSGVGGPNSEKMPTTRERENTIMRNDMKGTLTFKYHNNRNGIRKDYKNQNGNFALIYGASKYGDNFTNTESKNLKKFNYYTDNYNSRRQNRDGRYPSLDNIPATMNKNEVSIIIGPRPSFHSDPTPNYYETSEMGVGLTRSLDTGGWR